MKKSYLKPDAEFIRLSAKEALTNDELDGEEGLGGSEEGWD